jgi:homocysteine S-methyltransferase
MPGLKEARVMLKLLSEFKKDGYISFACQKGTTNAGEPFAEIVKTLKNEAPENLKGIGINCSEPEIVEEFGALMKANFPDLTLVCYPNSGESWTNNSGEWEVEASQWGGKRADLASYVPKWIETGFKWIGGCCRVEPKDISKIAEIVKNKK